VEVISEDGASISYLTSGQVVGRNALFDLVPEPRPEAAVAATRCLLFQLRRSDLCRVFIEDMEMLADYQLAVLGHGCRLWHVLCHEEARLNFVVSTSGGDVITAIAEFQDSLWRLSIELARDDRGSASTLPVQTEKAKRGGALAFFKKKEVQAAVLRPPSTNVRSLAMVVYQLLPTASCCC
jgi:hypothetical protein